MSLQYNIDNCFEETIGTNGLNKAQFKEIHSELSNILENIKNESIPVFDFSNKRTAMEQAQKVAEKIRKKADYLFVLGTGGATLCGQTLLGLREYCFNDEKKVIFVDNIDPLTMQNIAGNIDFSKSHFLVISKSGGTLETITQFLFFLSVAEKNNFKPSEKFTVITHLDNQNNKIRSIADNLDIEIIEHENVGGRFSIFTAVALLPAAFAGINISEFLSASENFFQESFNKNNDSTICGAALNILFSDKLSSSIMFPYEDRLRRFAFWYCQIYAESLGKNGKPLTPIKAFGTLDQHSVVQQFLGGRKDKLFTLVASNRQNKGVEISSKTFEKFAPDYLTSKKIGDVIEASFLSTVDTFAKNNIPTRVIRFDEMDESSLGELCAQSILEVVLIASYFNINAFDQPAVEQGKQTAVKILSK